MAPSLSPPWGWRYRHGSQPVTRAHWDKPTAGGTGAPPGPAPNNIGAQKAAKGNGAGARRAGKARRTRAQPQGSEDRTDEAPMKCCHVGPRGIDTAEA